MNNMSDFSDAVTEIYLSKLPGFYRSQPIFDMFRKQIIPDSVYSSQKKLNLGSSTRLLPGYVNVDALEERNPDIVCEISKLDFAKENEYDLVRASHVLEHFSYDEIPEVLMEWRRVLRVGGYFVICVPNFRALSWGTIIKPSGYNLDDETYKNGWVNGLFALDLPPRFRHKIVFHYNSLANLLNSHGFKVVGKLNYRKEHPFTLGVDDDSCNFMSLNIAAIKV
jgi:predicted SAM-dependent methyltransferase